MDTRLDSVEGKVLSAEENVSARIESAEERLANRLHSIDFDPRLRDFHPTAANLVGQTDGVPFVLRLVMLVRISEAFTDGYYRHHIGDRRRGNPDDKATRSADEKYRTGLLTDIILNAQRSVCASTYADADHIDFFWNNPSADAFIKAHRTALEKERPPTIRRVIIVADSLQHDPNLTLNLLRIAIRLYRQGMRDNYWLPEGKARKACEVRSVRFPDRGFLYADDTFLSEGWSKSEDQERRRPHFAFGAGLLELVQEQFDALLKEAQKANNRLSSISALELFAKSLGIDDTITQAVLKEQE